MPAAAALGDVDGALLLDEETVLHCTGRWLVCQHIDSAGAAHPGIGFFTELFPGVVRLTALCISENRKYAALCEQCESDGAPYLAHGKAALGPAAHESASRRG